MTESAKRSPGRPWGKVLRRKTFVSGMLLLIVAVVLTVRFISGPTVPGLQLGQAAPDFVLPNALGGDVHLADYIGKQPVLVYFSMGHG